jgi:hypothetical protein
VVRGAIAQVHVRPWSTVFRTRTSRGAVYLKYCGRSQAHEPRLTALLARAGGAVPTLVARHPHEDWMLLADGGRKLRDMLTPRELLREWTGVLRRYAAIQVALLGRERDLLATGTPDARLERLPIVVGEILDTALARSRGPDHLSADDVRRIRASIPVIEARCAELAQLGIGATVQHDDLHDANVLRKASRIVIFDWGDACVSHPFLSLLIALRAPAYRAEIAANDPRILRLRDAYLEAFEHVAPMAHLRRAAAIGRRLGMITRALAWSRANIDAEDGMLASHATFGWWLRQLPRAFPPGR